MVRAYRMAVSGMLAAALLVLPACSSGGGGTGDAGDLTGADWSLVKVGTGTQDISAARISAMFSDKTISGFSGVNTYGGAYTATSDGTFSVGDITSTLMAGPEPLMKIEQAYLALLGEADTYRVEGDRLTLSAAGEPVLVYAAAKAVVLPGSKWIVTGYNNGKQAVTSPSLGSTLTLEFGADGQVAGSAGVNTFNGPYSSGEATVAIGPLATTRMAGPEELMAQETAYLAALQAATAWSVAQGRLELRDAKGAMQVTGAAIR